MENRLKKATIKISGKNRPFAGRRIVVVECHGKDTFYREFRVEDVLGNHEDFLIREVGDHVVPTLIFRKGKNGRLYPVRKKKAPE
ncbi:MAG: hypothetical protein ACYCZW_02635 [Minisyncoccota bacterium]